MEEIFNNMNLASLDDKVNLKYDIDGEKNEIVIPIRDLKKYPCWDFVNLKRMIMRLYIGDILKRGFYIERGKTWFPEYQDARFIHIEIELIEL